MFRPYAIPRLRDVLFLAVFIAAVLLGPRMMSLDSDLGRHLALGGYILDRHTIPTRDIFSHTLSGEPRPAYEWLSQIGFALAYRVLGLDGTILLCALILGVAFSLTHADAEKRSGTPLLTLLIMILAMAASSLHWLPRPHLFTFLFLALWIERLERARRGEAIPLWHFSLLMLAWVNMHGGFIFGALVWLAYFAGWVWENLIAGFRKTNWKIPMIGAASLPMTILTPSGLGNWEAVLNNNSRYILSRTIETMPADFTQPGALPFAALLCLTLVLFARNGKNIPPAHYFLLGGFALLGLLMARNIPLFAIACAPILAEGLGAWTASAPRWKTMETNIVGVEKTLRGGLWNLTVCAAAALILWIRFEVRGEAYAQFNPKVFPVAASDWLETHPQSGNMFNDFNWGGYLLFRVWPRDKVFLDSQTDFYGEALAREYETALTAGEGWESVLEKYAARWTIIRADSPLAKALSRDRAWELIYSDAIASVFKRK